MWEIIDDNGTIHSGTEEELRNAMWAIINNQTDNEYYIDEWNGDLKLVEIKWIYK